MKGIFVKFNLQYGKADPEIYFRVFYHLMPSSHRRHGQDKTVLSCPRLRCEMSSRQSQTVFSCPEYI